MECLQPISGSRWPVRCTRISLAVGIVGIALPAQHSVVAGRYFLLAESNNDLNVVEDLLFSESELELLP